MQFYPYTYMPVFRSDYCKFAYFEIHLCAFFYNIKRNALELGSNKDINDSKMSLSIEKN